MDSDWLIKATNVPMWEIEYGTAVWNEQLRVNFDRANRERETADVKLLQVTDTLKTERRLVAEASSKLRQRICDAEDR